MENELVINEMIQKMTYLTIASKGNEKAFGSLKRCCEGRNIVVCGAGPTLNQYEPLEEAVHIALNRALLYKKIKYDYFFADDWLGIHFLQDEIEKYDCKKYFGRYGFGISTANQTIPQTFGNKCGAVWYYTDSELVGSGYESRFVVDIDKAPIGNMPNIGLQIMQVALFMNPKKIFLVGCDATTGHFYKDKNDEIFSKDDELIKVLYCDKTIEKWKILKKFADCYYPDIEIVSINPVGLKGIFNDIVL